ncbi:MAG: hypothetical protein ACRELG_02180 [Gemmataceae bacterium]
MRKFIWLTALTMGLAWAGSAHAQTTTSSSTLSNLINIMPNFTNNSPMSYVNPNMPIGGTTYSANTTGTAFPYTLSSMFYSPARTNTFSNTITSGQSTFPTQAQMQAAAPSYFQAFQMYRAAPIIQP